ncbi:nucleotidyltransferase domain-containing protein [Streptomyces sp. NPDC101225]|uniref:nucleotidyltransferase domain-containing protein n=1 Tax=Streptomyces sp. NPDC101225 TaxID=3366135 RepID=UPI003819233F
MADILPPGGTLLDEAELPGRWARAWRPEQVAERLAGVRAPWCVAAGWALDLFRGAQTRPHDDLEIAVPAAGFAEVRDRFPEYAWDAVGSGWIWAQAGPDVLAATHQTWLRDPATGRFLLDVFREPHDGDTWICRRDENLRLPYKAIVERTRDEVPYLAPEVVLLFKAKAPRPKDEADFAGVLPLLDRRRRERLGGWLERLHPGHRWSARLPVRPARADRTRGGRGRTVPSDLTR